MSLRTPSGHQLHVNVPKKRSLEHPRFLFLSFLLIHSVCWDQKRSSKGGEGSGRGGATGRQRSELFRMWQVCVKHGDSEAFREGGQWSGVLETNRSAVWMWGGGAKQELQGSWCGKSRNYWKKHFHCQNFIPTSPGLSKSALCNVTKDLSAALPLVTTTSDGCWLRPSNISKTAFAFEFFLR